MNTTETKLEKAEALRMLQVVLNHYGNNKAKVGRLLNVSDSTISKVVNDNPSERRGFPRFHYSELINLYNEITKPTSYEQK